MKKYLLPILIFAAFGLMGTAHADNSFPGAKVVFEIRSTATNPASTVNGNGGGFDASFGGTDYSQQNAPQVSWCAAGCANTNDLATPAATTSTLTSASGGFTSVMVGNVIHVTAGTNITAGWYVVTAFTSANQVILDRAVSTGGGAGSAGTGYLGGALSLGSSDSTVFALATSTATAATKFYVQGNATYTINGAVTPGNPSAAGNSLFPVIVEGYESIRGDRPVSSTRPIFAMGASVWTSPGDWDQYSLIVTGTAAQVETQGASNKLVDVKVVNTSVTATRVGILVGNADFLNRVEAISYNGSAVSGAANTITIVGSYLHDSNACLNAANSAFAPHVFDTIFENCITSGYINSGAGVADAAMVSNTFYGAENQRGTAINLAAGNANIRFVNNIFYGWTTALLGGNASQTSMLSMYNGFFNNGANATNAATSTSDVATNPNFANLAQTTGNASSTGTTLISTSTNFAAAGVVANQDYVYVTGNGITSAIYGITAVSTTTNPGDTLTVDNSLGTHATSTFSVTTGHNFQPGANMRAAGNPGTFPGGLTTGYLDIGAVQRVEQGTTAY